MSHAAVVSPIEHAHDGSPRPWLAVIWTKPRAEKAVARALEAKQVVHWLPTYLQKRKGKWSDRWKEVEFPLFPGYLFASAVWPR